MYQIASSKEYRKNIKKLRGSGKFKEDRLREIPRILVAGTSLPAWADDHALSGNLNSLRECHIKGDLLLIYYVNKNTSKVILSNVSTHHQIFGN